MSPKKGTISKRNFIFQPLIFRGYVTVVFGGACSGSSSSPKKRSETDWKDYIPFHMSDTSESFRRIVWSAGLAGMFQSDNSFWKIILENGYIDIIDCIAGFLALGFFSLANCEEHVSRKINIIIINHHRQRHHHRMM